MFRPANSNRKTVIDVAVASSVKVRNEVRQAKPLVKAMAAADRKWRQNHLRMPAGCDFKAVTIQTTGGMSIQAQQMLKRYLRQLHYHIIVPLDNMATKSAASQVILAQYPVLS